MNPTDYKQLVASPWATVRQFAKNRRAPFSADDLPLKRVVGLAACSQLCKRGELAMVSPPRYGRGGHPALYVLGTGSRPKFRSDFSRNRKLRRDLERYHAKAAAHRANGRTAHGALRQYASYPEAAHLAGRDRINARRRIWYANKTRTPQDRAWRQFRATLDIKPVEYLSPLER